VASLAALLVEANPALTPRELKLVIQATARRLQHVDVDRRLGLVDVRRACLAVSVARYDRRPKGPGRP
jgi:hypothetical protein